jgi:hypothetical protein
MCTRLFIAWNSPDIVLFCYLGDEELVVNDLGLACLMTDARHSSVHHASTYLQDACARFAREKRNDCGVLKGNQISPYESIYSSHQSVSQMSELSATGRNKKTLPEVVYWWYLTVLGYSPTAPVPSCFELLKLVAQKENRAATITPSDQAIEDGILAIALNPSIDSYTKTMAIKRWLKNVVSSPSEPPQGCLAYESTSDPDGKLPPTVSLRKKRRRGGTESVSERDSILDKSASPEERITAIQSAYLAHKDSLENLVHKDASFFNRSIKNAGRCLTECCKGDISDFFRVNPDFNVASKFACQCAY